MKRSVRWALLLSVPVAILVGARAQAAVSAASDRGEAYRYYLRALLLESEGHLPAAMEDLERAIGIAPDSAYLQRTAAEFSLRLGQLTRAEVFIERANELDPNDVGALVLAGQIAWASGDPDKAEAKLKQAVALDPDRSDAIVGLAGALTPKKPQEAVKVYNDFLIRHPGDLEALERLAQLYQSMGETDRAKETWKQTLEVEPNSARSHLALAQIAEISYDTMTALQHYDAVIAQDPGNLALLLRVGELRYRNNDMARAVEAFSRAETIAPNSASVNFWMALVREHEGDWNGAISYLTKLSPNPPDPGILLRLSYYYSQAARHREAVTVLERLCQLEPTNADFWNYLAMANEQSNQLAQAEKAQLKVVELKPGDPEALFQLASLYDRMGKFELAEPRLKAAIQLKPDYAMAMNYLGYSYADRNIHLPEAEKLIEAAVGLDPENSAYLDSMGWVYYRQGKYARAADFLRESVRRSDDAVVWNHLGDVELARGDGSAAVLAWDESLRADPRNKDVAKKIRAVIGTMPPQPKFNLFLKRLVTRYGDVASIASVVRVTASRGGEPGFEGTGRLRYDRGEQMSIEIPGPLGAPFLLVTKKGRGPTAYGAIHPRLQTAEYFVTRAFDEIHGLFSADLFRNADLSTLQSSARESWGALTVDSPSLRLVFSKSDGRLRSIVRRENSESAELTLVPWKDRGPNALPISLRWHDARTDFQIRVEMIDPSVNYRIGDAAVAPSTPATAPVSNVLPTAHPTKRQ